MHYINKIKRNISNCIEFVLEHIIHILFIICIIIGVIVMLIFLPKETILEDGVIKSQNILFFDITIDNWWTSFSILGIIMTAIWAIYQFDKTISRKQQEKGAEISKLVSERLMYRCDILGNVIIKSELNEIFQYNSLKPTVFKNFDKSELISLYNDNETIIQKIKSIVRSEELQQLYFRELETKINQIKYDDITDKKYTDKEAHKLFILDNKELPFKFTQLITSILNDLEYISMYISSQNTHSKYIYQSMHQFFIKTIKLLGPIISIFNKDYCDKYYTNIICVYNEWCRLRNIDLKKEIKKKEKINKILNPKIKTI